MLSGAGLSFGWGPFFLFLLFCTKGQSDARRPPYDTSLGRMSIWEPTEPPPLLGPVGGSAGDLLTRALLKGGVRRVGSHPPPPQTKTVQSAEGEQGKEKRERIIVVVRSPCQENYPADAHPSALKSVLESANPAWTWSVHLDAPGQRHGQ